LNQYTNEADFLMLIVGIPSSQQPHSKYKASLIFASYQARHSLSKIDHLQKTTTENRKPALGSPYVYHLNVSTSAA
jgi:hypothetical protein